MTDVKAVNGVEQARGKASMDTESETSMVKVEEISSSSETSNSRIPAIQPEDKSKEKVCGVCNDHEARYKCSRCQLPYCSVACATLHRATHPAVDDDAPPTTVESGPATNTNNVNGQTVKHTPGISSGAGSRNPFTALEDAKELQTLFMMYPRLRSQLRDIYIATLPPTDDSSGMSGHYEDQSNSYRGRGRGKGRNGRGRDRASWNTDRGTQDGIDTLCSAKEQYGKGGEGVREYAELVLKLVSMEGVDVARLVQEEVAEENAKIIAQLLNGDSF